MPAIMAYEAAGGTKGLTVYDAAATWYKDVTTRGACGANDYGPGHDVDENMCKDDDECLQLELARFRDNVDPKGIPQDLEGATCEEWAKSEEHGCPSKHY